MINLVEKYAVYCHSENPNAPRKCRRTWYTNGEDKRKIAELIDQNRRLEAGLCAIITELEKKNIVIRCLNTP